MENITMTKNNTTNTNRSTTTPTRPVFQDMPVIAQMKSVFPFCKSAKVGNLFYPVIASDKLMESITDDVNFVSAVRKVKSNAFNPSGSEHGITKKACDMLLENPSFRDIIRQQLIHGIYNPERITSSPVFVLNHMTLPRGYKNTVNKIVETMIVRYIKVSGMNECTMPCAWSDMFNPGAGKMIETVDQIRAKGPACWISLRLKSFPENIPHDRMKEKIHIMFQDKRVADLICTLLGRHESAADAHNGTQPVGISKDSLLASMLAYNLYMVELDQEIARHGFDFVRFNDEIVIFCDKRASAERIKGTLVSFVKNDMKCPVNYNGTRIKDISSLAFLRLRLHDGGNWRINQSLRGGVKGWYTRAVLKYATEQLDDSVLWRAYNILPSFIGFYEDVYPLETEIRNLKKWRDETFTGAITLAEKIRLGIIK